MDNEGRQRMTGPWKEKERTRIEKVRERKEKEREKREK